MDDPVALSKFDGLRAGFAMLPNADAGLARRTAHFRLVGVEKPTGELRMLRGLELAKSFYSTVMNCVIACMRYEKDGRTERAVVGTLTESTCLPMYWALIRGVKGGLSVQLAHLVTVDNIIFLLGVELKDREAELLKRPKLAAIQNRITKLKLFINIVKEGAVSQQLSQWARVVYEANQSRWALLKNGHKEGPAKLLSAARVQCIPLICARANEVFHFFEAFGLPTTVRGCFRSGTVVDEHVFPVPTDYSVTSLCKDNRPEMGTRCVLRNGLCSVGPPGKPVRFEHRWMISYEYEARIVPRVAECLGVGVGALQAIDPGGRAFTVDTLECTAKEDGSERFKVTAKEYFKTLPDKILERTAKSGGKLSRAQISRNERNRDIKAKQFYKKLEARIKAAKGDGKTSAAEIKAMEKQQAQQGRCQDASRGDGRGAGWPRRQSGRGGEGVARDHGRDGRGIQGKARGQGSKDQARQGEDVRSCRGAEGRGQGRVSRATVDRAGGGPLPVLLRQAEGERAESADAALFSQVQGREAHAAPGQVDQHGDAPHGGGGAGRDAGQDDSRWHERGFVRAPQLSQL